MQDLVLFACNVTVSDFINKICCCPKVTSYWLQIFQNGNTNWVQICLFMYLESKEHNQLYNKLSPLELGAI